jgi:hypothetical protein
LCKGAKDSLPHAHGPAWAICGRARGEIPMPGGDLVSPASADQSGKEKAGRNFRSFAVSLYDEFFT